MKGLLKGGIMLALCIGMTMSAKAQKYGYINSDQLLQALPESKEISATLEALNTQLQKQGQQMVQNFQQKQQAAMARQEKGELSPMEQQKLGEELQKEEQEIVKFQQESEKKLDDKRREKLQPLLEKINNAIAAVAKDGGYTMIFEQQALLFADPSMDVKDLVLAKLK